MKIRKMARELYNKRKGKHLLEEEKNLIIRFSEGREISALERYKILILADKFFWDLDYVQSPHPEAKKYLLLILEGWSKNEKMRALCDKNRNNLRFGNIYNLHRVIA